MILRNCRQHYRIKNLRKLIEKLSLSKKIHLSPTPTWQPQFGHLENFRIEKKMECFHLCFIIPLVDDVFLPCWSFFKRPQQFLAGAIQSGRHILGFVCPWLRFCHIHCSAFSRKYLSLDFWFRGAFYMSFPVSGVFVVNIWRHCTVLQVQLFLNLSCFQNIMCVLETEVYLRNYTWKENFPEIM